MSEAFLVAGTRTPMGRYGGALAAVRSDDLAAHVIAATLASVPSVDAAAVDEVVLGCANQAGEDNRNVARMAGCSPACRTPCRARRSTGCAAPGPTPSRTPRGRSPSARPTSSWRAASSR
jgi:acetyl-CoA acetyltransferase